MYQHQIFLFWYMSRDFILWPRVFSRALGCAAHRGPACTPRRECGSRLGSVACALGVQSRVIWQVIARRRVPPSRGQAGPWKPTHPKKKDSNRFSTVLLFLVCARLFTIYTQSVHQEINVIMTTFLRPVSKFYTHLGTSTCLNSKYAGTPDEQGRLMTFPLFKLRSPRKFQVNHHTSWVMLTAPEFSSIQYPRRFLERRLSNLAHVGYLSPLPNRRFRFFFFRQILFVFRCVFFGLSQSWEIQIS